MSQKYADIEEHIKGMYLFVSMMLILLSAFSAIGIHLFITRPLRNIENRLLGHATGESTDSKNKILSHEFIQLYKTIDKLEALTTSKMNYKKKFPYEKMHSLNSQKQEMKHLKPVVQKVSFLQI